MIDNWFRKAPRFLSATYQMTVLSWQAQKGIFLGLLLLQVIQGLIPLAQAWVFKGILDLVASIAPDDNNIYFIQDLLTLLIILGVINVTGQMIGEINSYFNGELGRQLQLKTHAIIYDRVAGINGLAYFENPEFHDTLRLASQGIYSGPSRILNTFTSIIRSIITLSSFLGVLVFLSPMLALIIVVATLPKLIAQIKISHQRFEVMFRNSPKERLAAYLGQVLSSTHFAKEVRLFNLKDYFLHRFLQTTRDVHKLHRQQQLREMKWQLGLGLLSSIITSVGLILVVSQALVGRITIGDVTLYSSALSSVQGSITSIILAFANLNESVLFFSRYKDLMALPAMLKTAKSPIPVQPLKSAIEFRNVSFRYTDNHPWVLKGINLIFPKGKCLALVGLNGAGKTTIVKLLTRLYDPTEGQILWDGIDIREFDLAEYRQHIGAIFQDFAHYDLTAQENIGLGNVLKIDDLASIRQAAEDAGADEFVDRLAQGYQTVLSRWLVEAGPGTDLSGGQWQKIAIARMFMRDSEFLILDEPTAALDAESEYEIFSHFANLVSGHTSLLISHRFSTVRIADVIAVIDDGKVIEYGAHDELLTEKNIYAKLFTMQAGQYLYQSDKE